jgi:hypothetical protein
MSTSLRFIDSLLVGFVIAWLVIDLRPSQAQAQTGGFPKGGTTFTPSGNGVRWPITLVPTPGRPLGVSNMMRIAAPGTPPGANTNLAPGAAIRGTSLPSPGTNLGGFGSVQEGFMDLGGPVIYPAVTGLVGEQVGTLPYGMPISGTVEAYIPTGPVISQTPPATEATVSNANNEAGAVAPFTAPMIGYQSISATVPPAASSNSANLANASSATGGLRGEVQDILRYSSGLDSRETIQVPFDGVGLVLRGIVKDEHERRLAEAIALLTPGVRGLRNELAVAPPVAQSNKEAE